MDLHDHSALKSVWYNFKKRFPEENSFLLQRQIGSGIELLLGITYDPTFQHLVSVALGGIHTEIFKDAVFRACPISQREALEMIEELKGRKLLEGFRNSPVVDKGILAAIISKLSTLPDQKQEIRALDLNPVICFSGKLLYSCFRGRCWSFV